MPDPRRDTEKLAQLLSWLVAEPKSIKQIQGRFDLSERTAYRWLEYLRQDGHQVATFSISEEGERKFGAWERPEATCGG